MALATTTSTVAGILPDDYGPLIVTPVRKGSVALNPVVSTTLETTSTHLRVPRVTGDATAAFVAENAQITPSDPTIDQVTITPKKVVGLNKISNELAADSNPAAQTLVGESIAADIARKIDAAFFGNTTSHAPNGLESLGTITPIDPGASFDDLDAFADAIAAVEDAGGTPTAFVTTPAVAKTLAKLKDAVDSIRPLLTIDPSQEQARTVFGLPLYTSSAVTADTAWCFDPAATIVALRQDVTVEVDRSFYFDYDATAVKVAMRIGWAVVDQSRIAKIYHT